MKRTKGILNRGSMPHRMKNKDDEGWIGFDESIVCDMDPNVHTSRLLTVYEYLEFLMLMDKEAWQVNGSEQVFGKWIRFGPPFVRQGLKYFASGAFDPRDWVGFNELRDELVKRVITKRFNGVALAPVDEWILLNPNAGKREKDIQLMDRVAEKARYQTEAT